MAPLFFSSKNIFLDGVITDVLSKPLRTGEPAITVECPYGAGSVFRKAGRHIVHKKFHAGQLDDYTLRLEWSLALPLRKLAEGTTLADALYRLSFETEPGPAVVAARHELQQKLAKYVERHFTHAPGVAHITFGGVSYAVLIREAAARAYTHAVPIGVVSYAWPGKGRVQSADLLFGKFEGTRHEFLFSFERLGIYTTA